jgi:hypothetical protein
VDFVGSHFCGLFRKQKGQKVAKIAKDSFFVLFATFCPFCFLKRMPYHKIRCGQQFLVGRSRSAAKN